MTEMVEFLKGKKTNLLLIGYIILGMLGSEGVLNTNTVDSVHNMMIPLMGMSGAAKIDRMVKALQSPAI